MVNLPQNPRQELDLTSFSASHGQPVEWRISDAAVPYPEAVALHKALDKFQVPNQLVTIPGGKHGGFTSQERDHIYLTIREFLGKNGLGPK